MNFYEHIFLTIYKPIDAIAPRKIGRALGAAVTILWMMGFFLFFSIESHFASRGIFSGVILIISMAFNSYYFEFSKRKDYENIVLSYKPKLFYQVLVFFVIPVSIIFFGVFASF